MSVGGIVLVCCSVDFDNEVFSIIFNFGGLNLERMRDPSLQMNSV